MSKYLKVNTCLNFFKQIVKPSETPLTSLIDDQCQILSPFVPS